MLGISRGLVHFEPGIIPRIRSEANFRIPDIAVSCECDDHGLRALAEARLVVEFPFAEQRG